MHYDALIPLLADMGDLVQTLIALLVMVLYGVAQLVGNWQEGKKRKPAPPRKRSAMPDAAAAGQRPAPKQAPGRDDAVRREVEEFLRRGHGQAHPQPPVRPQPAEQRREAPTRQPQPPRRKPAPPRRPALSPLGQEKRPGDRPTGSPAESGGTPLGGRTPLADPTPLTTAATTTTAAGAPLGSGVAQHVAEHLRGAREIAEHTRRLGAEVALADDRLEQRLQEKFEHRLGSMTQQAATTTQHRQPTSPMAQELLAALSRPEGVRQLIIAGEILRRPEERWD